MNQKAIKTILHLGELKGIKIHQIGNDNIRCLEFHKNNIEKLDNIKISNNSGIYFLYKNDEKEIYIGKTSDIHKRMRQHNTKKEFNSVFAFVMENNDFSQTYIDYIEYHYINKLNNQSYYKTGNKDKRINIPNVSEHELITINDNINCIDIFLYMNNIDLDLNVIDLDSPIFYCKDAMLIYKNGIFILLKGSIIFNEFKLENVNKKTNKYDTWYEKRGEKLQSFIHKNIESLTKIADKYTLTRDIEIDSPSWAACLARGTHSENGWRLFKNENKSTIDEIYRK